MIKLSKILSEIKISPGSYYDKIRILIDSIGNRKNEISLQIILTRYAYYLSNEVKVELKKKNKYIYPYWIQGLSKENQKKLYEELLEAAKKLNEIKIIPNDPKKLIIELIYKLRNILANIQNGENYQFAEEFVDDMYRIRKKYGNKSLERLIDTLTKSQLNKLYKDLQEIYENYKEYEG